MAKNCRFAIAVHVAILLALSGTKPATSEWIAGSVNTNPVVVRRILSALSKAGLVRSSRGINGGSVLALPPKSITLLAINRAVDEAEAPSLHHTPPNQKCPVGRNILPVLTTLLERASAASDAILAATTLAEVMVEMDFG
jgi:Rrf2 family protein